MGWSSGRSVIIEVIIEVYRRPRQAARRAIGLSGADTAIEVGGVEGASLLDLPVEGALAVLRFSRSPIDQFGGSNRHPASGA